MADEAVILGTLVALIVVVIAVIWITLGQAFPPESEE